LVWCSDAALATFVRAIEFSTFFKTVNFFVDSCADDNKNKLVHIHKNNSSRFDKR